MKRHVPGLHEESSGAEIPDGNFLVRVERASYQYHPHKPYFALRFAVLQPQTWAQKTISGRIYCTPKVLWKLSWFLRDFGYDTDLLGRDEVDEKALLGLRGVVRISHTVLSGRRFLNLERFAPAADWEELSTTLVGTADRQEAAHDL